MSDAWQPIETAPRDGTRLIVAIGEFVTAAYWDAQFEYVWDDDADTDGYRGAWTDNTVASWNYQERTELQPTAWQPLPAPPEHPNGD